jgi:hypothetical protein
MNFFGKPERLEARHVAFWLFATVHRTATHVGYGLKADVARYSSNIRFLAQSGHPGS